MIVPFLRQDLQLLSGSSSEHGSPTWLLYDVLRNKYFFNCVASLLFLSLYIADIVLMTNLFLDPKHFNNKSKKWSCIEKMISLLFMFLNNKKIQNKLLRVLYFKKKPFFGLMISIFFFIDDSLFIFFVFVTKITLLNFEK